MDSYKQRLHKFLMPDMQAGQSFLAQDKPSAIAAAGIYDALADLFAMSVNNNL